MTNCLDFGGGENHYLDPGCFKDYHCEIGVITLFWHITSQITLHMFYKILQDEIIISSDKSWSMVWVMTLFQIWFRWKW